MRDDRIAISSASRGSSSDAEPCGIVTTAATVVDGEMRESSYVVAPHAVANADEATRAHTTRERRLNIDDQAVTRMRAEANESTAIERPSISTATEPSVLMWAI